MKKLNQLFSFLTIFSLALYSPTFSKAACTTPITGPSSVCQFSSITLGDVTGGGAWTSLTPALASVGATTGVVSGIATGAASIQYVVGGCTYTYAVAVNAIPAIISGSTQICQHSSTILSDATGGGTWTSGSPTVASAGAGGVVNGLGTSGVAAISYTIADGCFSVFYITVHTPPAPISGTAIFCSYQSSTLSEAIGGGVWSSSTPSVATVTSFGFVAGVMTGTTVISYTITGCTPAMQTVTIAPTPSPINGMTSICSHAVTRLTDSSAGGTWSSSDTTIAIISATGDISCIDTVVGTIVTITYTLPTGCLTTINEVVQTAPKSIYGIDSICKGASTTLFDSTTGGIWSSTSLAGAAVIDTSGIVTGVSPGLYFISYTLASGCYAAFPFYVKPLIPGSVSITASPGDSICAGVPDTFVAHPVNGGVPSFYWSTFFLGTYTHTSSDTFYAFPIHGDVIICKMITSGICSVSDIVYDSLGINVLPHVSPSVSIINGSAPVDSAISYGQIFTFFSSVIYGGTNISYQWYANGILIPGATNSSYAATVYQDSTFSCRVIGNPPCDNTTDTAYSNGIKIYATYLGVNPLNKNLNHFSLFPNPNNGSFTLNGQINSFVGNEINIEITDILGREVYTGKLAVQNGMVNEQVILDNQISPGTYLLRINSGTENEVIHFDINK